MLTLSCDTMDISIRDGVTLIQLTGGSATQSFSREFLPKIREAIIGSIGCKAIVITGEGNFFSAGADIKAFQKSIEDGDSCLLYTSPSPRDLAQSRMPSSA